MLLAFFNNCFTKLNNVHNYNTKQKTRTKVFQYFVVSESRRKTLHHIGLKVWKNVPKEFCHCPFPTLEKYLKTNTPLNYKCCEIAYNVIIVLILAYCKLHNLNSHCFYLNEYCFPKSCVHFILPNTRIAGVFYLFLHFMQTCTTIKYRCFSLNLFSAFICK